MVWWRCAWREDKTLPTAMNWSNSRIYKMQQAFKCNNGDTKSDSCQDNLTKVHQ